MKQIACFSNSPDAPPHKANDQYRIDILSTQNQPFIAGYPSSENTGKNRGKPVISLPLYLSSQPSSFSNSAVEDRYKI